MPDDDAKVQALSTDVVAEAAAVSVAVPPMTDTTLLTAAEARVLGCLVEKQLTTPDYYPLTLNALVCLQPEKQSRSRGRV